MAEHRHHRIAAPAQSVRQDNLAAVGDHDDADEGDQRGGGGN